MKILICDDNKLFVEELMEFCYEYFKNNKIDVEIEGTTDAEKIEANSSDILILDIDMPKRNGIDIKNSLERYGNGPLIIFATNFGGLIKEAIGKNVIGFIEKPINSFQMSALLKKATELIPQNVLIEISAEKHHYCNEIIYITVESIYTNVYLTKGRTETNIRKPMKDWEAKLSSYDFLRISESCMINARYVEDFSDDKIQVKYIDNPFIVSRRRKADCKERYFDYCRRMAVYL